MDVVLLRKLSRKSIINFEIKEREILNNRETWYNRAAGGQYGRDEKHSELTSIAMKEFYASDKGREYKNKNNFIEQINIFTNQINNELGCLINYKDVYSLIIQSRVNRCLNQSKKVL